MTGLRYSPLHVTELRGEMQGNFKVGCARLKTREQYPSVTGLHGALGVLGLMDYVSCSNLPPILPYM